MVTSSSSVMPSLSLLRMILDRPFFSMAKNQFTGVRITISVPIMGAENMANCSGASLAMLLGETSPKMSTTMVITAVATTAPFCRCSPTVKNRVDREDAVRLTMLLPTRMVDSRLSYLSTSARARAARRSPASALLLRRMRLREVKAVSVAEK